MKIKRLIALSAMAAALASAPPWLRIIIMTAPGTIRQPGRISKVHLCRTVTKTAAKTRSVNSAKKKKRNASNGKRKNASGLKPTAKRKKRISTTRISRTGLISKQASNFEGE